MRQPRRESNVQFNMPLAEIISHITLSILSVPKSLPYQTYNVIIRVTGSPIVGFKKGFLFVKLIVIGI